MVSANDITYDNSIDYEDGTIGKAIQDLEINLSASDPLSSEEALAYFKDNKIFSNAIWDLDVEYVNSHFTDELRNLDKYLTIPVTIPMKNLETGNIADYTLCFKADLDMISDNSAEVTIHVGKYVCVIWMAVETSTETGEEMIVIDRETWYEIDF